MSELSDLLRAHLPKGWSARQVAREARKRGHKLSDAAATAYLGGRHGSPSDQVLEALADTLKVPLARLREASGLVPQIGDPWTPPENSRYLRSDQRVALERLISTMITREEAGEGHERPAANTQALRAVAMGDEGDPEAADRQDERARRSSAEQRRNIEEMKRRKAEKGEPPF